ncbi:MAG TPA: hypothetical protein VM537_21980 [Anaerolineae bacterium]|nr:hypothetical protein [Anaerolineae bacterium]
MKDQIDREFSLLFERTVDKPDATRWIEEEVEKLQELLHARPRATDNLRNYDITQWQRKFHTEWGRLIGRLETLVAWKIIPPEIRDHYQVRLRALLQTVIAAVITGQG